jgi:hypothetical protein
VIGVLKATGMKSAKQLFGLLSSVAAMNSLGRIYAEQPSCCESKEAGSLTTPASGRRSGQAIASDIRECAQIWLCRAEELFGNQAMVDDFNHAVQCAERFEGLLRDKKKSKSGSPSIAAAGQVPSAGAPGASPFAHDWNPARGISGDPGS